MAISVLGVDHQKRNMTNADLEIMIFQDSTGSFKEFIDQTHREVFVGVEEQTVLLDDKHGPVWG